MKVGVPQALLYYRYGRFWREFLAGLGHEVVVSRRTDKALLQRGLSHVSSEVCLPIKIIAGHLDELAGQVDAVFLPRLLWLEDRLYACPKMIGIVDIAHMMLRDRVKVIAPSIRGNEWLPYFRAGMALCRNPVRVAQALARAQRLLPGPEQMPEFPPGEKRVALLGHFYNLKDEFISRPLLDTFTQHGYRICTKDELPRSLLHSRQDWAAKIRWVYERELYNAFRFLLDKVSGVCMVVSMGCGPDSLVAEFMREEAGRQNVPFLQLVIDEHTGTAGIVTRIEAFLELAERSRNRARETTARGDGRQGRQSRGQESSPTEDKETTARGDGRQRRQSRGQESSPTQHTAYSIQHTA